MIRFPAVLCLCALWPAVARAETVIDDTVRAAGEQYGAAPCAVFVNSHAGYVVYVEADGQVSLRETTDGGAAWHDPVNLGQDQDDGHVGVWYDPWTPGVTGTAVHIVHIGEEGATADDLYYTFIDTAKVPTNRWTLVREGSLYRSSTHAGCSVIRTVTGGLFTYASGEFGSADGIVSWSDDGGTNWIDIDPTDCAVDDYAQLLPLSGGDVLLIRQDISDDVVRSSVWDATGETWSAWTDIDTWVDYAERDAAWAGSVEADGDVILVGHTAPGNGLGKLKAYRFTNSTRTWEALGDIHEDPGGQVGGSTVMIDPVTGDIYAVYARGSLNYFESIYFKTSTDGGLTWSQESHRLNSEADDYRVVRGNFASGDRLYAVWYDADDGVLFGGTVAEPSAAGPPSPPVRVENVAPAEVGSSDAVLRGRVTGASPSPAVSVYWGDVDGESTESAWSQTSTPGLVVCTSGLFSASVSGLTTGVTYYYRCFASNAAGSAWAESSTGFVTRPPDATIDDDILSASYEYNPGASVVFVSDMVGYAFYLDSVGDDPRYKKTVDGGRSWGWEVDMGYNIRWANLAVWYDRWTPGNATGTCVHVAVAER
ncbi:sialidase family protein, partial [Verrucomicrobiota bacterium]